jgi:hypothetical protein
MDACVGGAPIPPPEGASNLQPVLHHAGIVSAQNWSTGPEALGRYQSALGQVACRLTALGRTNLRGQGQSSG